MKMKLGLMGKQVLLILSTVIVSSMLIFFTSLYFTKKGFNVETQETISDLQNIINTSIEVGMNTTINASFLIAENQTLIEAVRTGNQEGVIRIAEEMMEQMNVDIFIINDINAKVLTGEDSIKIGDSVSAQQEVQKSLNGESVTGFFSTPEILFSFYTVTPIKHNDQIIGSIMIGNSLISPRFIDAMKDTFNVEVTIFQGDMRAMTTLRKEDGSRAVDTHMQNPKVVETVLGKGEIFLEKNTILGKVYETAYWPISKEEPSLGMWFIGMPINIVEATLNQITQSVLLVSIITIIIMIFVAIRYARSFIFPITYITAFAVDVSNGQLDRELTIKVDDELGLLAGGLKKMVEMLKTKIEEQALLASKEVEKTHEAEEATRIALEAASAAQSAGTIQAANRLSSIVNTVSIAAQELFAKVEEASSGADLQRERASEIASAMGEMNSTVLSVAQNAAEAASTSETAKTYAETGAISVQSVTAGINMVQQHSDMLQQGMEELGERASDISRVMSVISDIADQTNLLALNAAIEAARAGDAGRGFAVVAAEVRKLAEKTMLATKEVALVTEGIQKGTQSNIDQVSDTVKEILTATEKTYEAGSALQQIVDLSEVTSDQVQTIATASEEQSATSEAINYSINDINRIAEETSDTMQSSKDVLAELMKQLVELQRVIEELQQG